MDTDSHDSRQQFRFLCHHELEIVRVAPTTRLPRTGTELGFEDRTVFRITDGSPLSASVRCENRAFRRRCQGLCRCICTAT